MAPQKHDQTEPIDPNNLRPSQPIADLRTINNCFKFREIQIYWKRHAGSPRSAKFHALTIIDAKIFKINSFLICARSAHRQELTLGNAAQIRRLIRLHQFNKMELYWFVAPEASEAAHEAIWASPPLAPTTWRCIWRAPAPTGRSPAAALAADHPPAAPPQRQRPGRGAVRLPAVLVPNMGTDRISGR